jgi:hypothetical protein
LDADDLGRFVTDVLADAGIATELLPEGPEITTRQTESERYTFLINHSVGAITAPVQGVDLLTGEPSAREVPARGVMVVFRSDES